MIRFTAIASTVILSCAAIGSSHGGSPDPIKPGVEDLLAARLVSIKLENQCIRDGFQQLEKQTGYRVQLPEGKELDNKRYQLSFENVTYWEAFDRLCNAGWLIPVAPGTLNHPTFHRPALQLLHAPGRFQPRDDRARLEKLRDAFARRLKEDKLSEEEKEKLTAQLKQLKTRLDELALAEDSWEKRIVRRGALRLAVSSVSHTTGTIAAGNNPSKSINSSGYVLSLAVEPRFQILQLKGLDLSEIRDDQKNSLIRKDPNNVTESLVRSHQCGVYAPFHKPEKGARVVKLKGVVTVTLITEEKVEVLVADIDKIKDTEIKLDGQPFQAKEVVELPARAGQPRGFKLAFVRTVKNPEKSPLPTHRLELHDEKGRAYRSAGAASFIAGNLQQGGVEFVAIRGQEIGKPVKLVFLTWTTKDVEIPFDFENLPQ